MATAYSNPDSCCGIQTSCCPDKIPTEKPLTATYSNSCGSWEIELVYQGGTTPIWIGTRWVQCFDSVLPGCVPANAYVEVRCLPAGEWQRIANSAAKNFGSEVCEPLMMEITDVQNQATACNSPDDLATVTVTE